MSEKWPPNAKSPWILPFLTPWIYEGWRLSILSLIFGSFLKGFQVVFSDVILHFRSICHGNCTLKTDGRISSFVENSDGCLIVSIRGEMITPFASCKISISRSELSRDCWESKGSYPMSFRSHEYCVCFVCSKKWVWWVCMERVKITRKMMRILWFVTQRGKLGE